MTKEKVIKLACKKADIEYPNWVEGKVIIIDIDVDYNGVEKSFKVKFIGKPWSKLDARRYDNWTFVEFIE